MNWGKSIVLVFIVFASFIGGMVYLMTKQRVDLVRSDYYQDEIAYQQQIDRVARTVQLGHLPAFTVDGAHQQLVLNIPAGWTKGALTFYRPSDQHQDRLITLIPNQQLVSTGRLAKGLWRAQLNWSADGKEYYYEASFTQP